MQIRLLSVLLVVIMASGCVSHDRLLNFNEAQLNYQSPEEILNAMELRIQAEDLLRITVHSGDPTAAAPFNIEEGQQNQMMFQQGGGGQAGSNTLELFTGYFVDQTGHIDFPVVGRVAVEGLTLEEAKFKLLEELKTYLNDAVVNIRFLNFKVTVLGEVNAPGTIRLSNKRVTLLEALGLAGDLTPYANRKELLIIREQDGQRLYERLDLQSEEIFTSPFFYLKQNDVIYIEPIPARVATVADPAGRVISYTSAILSIATLIIALTR